MKKWLLAVLFVGCSLLSFYNSYCVIPELEMQVREMSARTRELEVRQSVLNAELAMKTHPEYVDMSLRAWFEQQLRDDREQVRGIDGKYARER